MSKNFKELLSELSIEQQNKVKQMANEMRKTLLNNQQSKTAKSE